MEHVRGVAPRSSRFCKPPGSLAPSTCEKGVRTNPGRSAREDFSRVRPRCSSGNWWSLPVSRRTLPVFSGPPSLDQPKLRKWHVAKGSHPAVRIWRPDRPLGHLRRVSGCRWRTRTSDLVVMSHASCRCSNLQVRVYGFCQYMVDPAEFASAPGGLKVRCAAVTPRVRGKVVTARGGAQRNGAPQVRAEGPSEASQSHPHCTP